MQAGISSIVCPISVMLETLVKLVYESQESVIHFLSFKSFSFMFWAQRAGNKTKSGVGGRQ